MDNSDMGFSKVKKDRCRKAASHGFPICIRSAMAIQWCFLFIIVMDLHLAWAQNTTEFQHKAIPRALVYTDPDLAGNSSAPCAVIVDKARQQISLYHHSGYWKTTAKWPCSTGKKTGPKKSEGDQKTPEGVYFAVREVTARFLTDTYGTRALPLDYPNWWDQHRHRSGSAIWLHGTNRPLQSRDSNGCVVIDNPAINNLARHIQLNLTPVIIVKRNHFWSVKSARRTAHRILSAVEQWHQAMMYGNYRSFSRWYAPDQRPSMKWWQRWCRQRQKHKTASGFKSLLRRRAIYRTESHFLVLFDHHLVVRTESSWVGRRKMYLSLAGDNVSIVGDTYQTAPGRTSEPLFYAWQKLWQKEQQRCKMAVKNRGNDNT